MSNIPEYSVSEISQSIKNSLETQFSRIKVKGEISGLSKANSGHIYFNLKDEDSLLSSIIWRSRTSLLNLDPEEGLEVIATGKISTYMPRSNYNFIVENIKVSGEGAILKLIEERKKRLKEKGYFDENKKKLIPFIPSRIGIITSPSGAVIQDMKKKIRERFPSNIILWPVAVQGPNSEKDITDAINGFNSMQDKPDVIILARGGGSLEDLLSFNSEDVADAIFASEIPLISAVGHETDFSISDMVADIRASTPTAAADIVVPEREELLDKIYNTFKLAKTNLENLLNIKYYKLDNYNTNILSPENSIKSFKRKVSDECIKIDIFLSNYLKNFEYIKNLNLINPERKLEENILKLNDTNKYFNNIMEVFLDKKKSLIDSEKEILISCSYEKWLKKGFVIVKNSRNHLVKRVSKLKDNQDINIRFLDGNAKAKVSKIIENN